MLRVRKGTRKRIATAKATAGKATNIPVKMPRQETSSSVGSSTATAISGTVTIPIVSGINTLPHAPVYSQATGTASLDGPPPITSVEGNIVIGSPPIIYSNLTNPQLQNLQNPKHMLNPQLQVEQNSSYCTTAHVYTSPQTGCSSSTLNNGQINTPIAIRSANDDIALNVSNAVKEKIIRGEYIDLSMLLTNSSNLNLQKQNLIVEQGQIALEPAIKVNKISNIEMWSDAFIIFISIYCSVHVEKFQEMLKYMNSVRLGAKRCSGNGWYLYDQQYRLKKAQDPSSLWGSMDPELWLMCIQPNPVNYSRKQGLKCYSFNYEGFCAKVTCYYQHSCMKCNNGHPILRCPLDQSQNQNVQRKYVVPGTQVARRHTDIANMRGDREGNPHTFRGPAYRPRSVNRETNLPRYMGPRHISY